jgi:hypothetical protein
MKMPPPLWTDVTRGDRGLRLPIGLLRVFYVRHGGCVCLKGVAHLLGVRARTAPLRIGKLLRTTIFPKSFAKFMQTALRPPWLHTACQASGSSQLLAPCKLLLQENLTLAAGFDC